VIQYRRKKVRRQEMVVKGVQCFKCGKEGHKKWECPKMKEERRKKQRKQMWKEMKEHCGARGLFPRGAVMSMERWMMWREVVTFVKCRGCDYKGIKTQENRGQSFLNKGQLYNM